jgi:hypothetical protein
MVRWVSGKNPDLVKMSFREAILPLIYLYSITNKTLQFLCKIGVASQACYNVANPSSFRGKPVPDIKLDGTILEYAENDSGKQIAK